MDSMGALLIVHMYRVLLLDVWLWVKISINHEAQHYDISFILWLLKKCQLSPDWIASHLLDEGTFEDVPSSSSGNCWNGMLAPVIPLFFSLPTYGFTHNEGPCVTMDMQINHPEFSPPSHHQSSFKDNNPGICTNMTYGFGNINYIVMAWGSRKEQEKKSLILGMRETLGWRNWRLGITRLDGGGRRPFQSSRCLNTKIDPGFGKNS